MKTIYKIARTELQTLFYSPVAWLILVIFMFQVGMAFCQIFGTLVRQQALEYGLSAVTSGVFGGVAGLFAAVQQYLYLYIPLLTMGLMSRELASGSIKLLYSSPVTNTQIILAKFLAMMIYALMLIGVLVIFVIFSSFTIKSIDIPAILSGLLGLYLLICAYSAIGLFMSSVTSYQVVAAMGTLAILAVLKFVGGMWQDVEFVRDITYWLSINGRANEFINGLICSEDFLYFVIVISLFLSLSIIKLQAGRQKSPWRVTAGKYLIVFCGAMLLGYLTSRPMLMGYYDATRTKVRTLTAGSQDIMAKMKGDLTITTYVNLLEENHFLAVPKAVNRDLERFKQYVRFKPDTEIKYVYYYDKAKNPGLDKRYPDLNDKERAEKLCEVINLKFDMLLSPEEIRKEIDLSSEGNRFVRLLERESGEKTFLRVFDDMKRVPGDAEISAALKRLVMELPKVGFLTGHGERDSKRKGDRDYNRFAQDKPFRHSLVNQGFDFTEVTLEQDIAEEIDILVIAELKNALTESEMERLKRYVERGGNLMIAGEPRRQEVMNSLVEQFGVQFIEGVIVKKSEHFAPDLILARPTTGARELSYPFNTLFKYEIGITMPSCSGLTYTADRGYTVTPLFVTDSVGCWSELETTDFIDDVACLNPEIGEEEKTFTTALALSRKVGMKEQKIVILGDADCLSNGEISMSRKDMRAGNYYLVSGSFFWLSDGEVPIDVRRPVSPDNEIYLGEDEMYFWRIMLMGIFPGVLAIFAIILWIRRRGR